MAEKNSKQAKTSRKTPFFEIIMRKEFLLCAFALALSLICLVLVIFIPPFQSLFHNRSHSAPVVSDPLSIQNQLTKTNLSYAPQAEFEEKTENLEQKAKEVDLILLQTLVELGVKPDHLKHKEVMIRVESGQLFHHQTIILYLSPKHADFIPVFKQRLTQWSDSAKIHQSTWDTARWDIAVSGHYTHQLILKKNGIPPVQTYANGDNSSKLVIIIDDLGESLQAAQQLADLPVPITFSVLPHNSRTDDVVALAQKHNIDLLLHLPMEPKGYPEKANPGPGALFVSMNRDQLVHNIRSALDKVPGAIGTNNHMGSLFTEHIPGMSVVLRELKSQKMFFLDSLTSPRSAAEYLSKSIGVPYFQRSIFLDNVPNPQLIVYQLQKAEKLARKHGLAFAIGHPYPETLIALKQWTEIKNKRIKVTSIREAVGPVMVASGMPLSEN